MSEDSTAAAALAIERYVAGLRKELEILGAKESGDLAREISDMLTDAARNDAEHAFAEMERLGAPSELAATLLAERGVVPGGAMPTAAWWRLGIAATIDIAVGLAAPVAVIVAFYGGVWRVLSFGPTFATLEGNAAQYGALALIGVLLVFACTLAWRSWTPWRNGGRTLTPGMALTGIAVVRVGGSRAAVRVSDLRAAGLVAPSVTVMSAATALASIAVAAIVLTWSASLISTGALDPSGAGVVTRFAGASAKQEAEVTRAVQDLYEAARMKPAEFAVWPAIEDVRLDPDNIKKELRQTFASVPATGSPAYEMVHPMQDAPGMWQVSVTEMPGTPEERMVILEYSLRVDWVSAGSSQESAPTTTWVLSSYDWTPN
jgi:hypothetical protein